MSTMANMLTAIEDPKVTDWMQGWGSIAGVGVGLLAAGITGALLWYEIVTGSRARKDAARDRAEAAEDRALAAAERRDAEIAQARTIVISDVGVVQGPPGVITRVDMFVANHGPGPILDLEVFLLVEGADITLRGKRAARGVLGPGEQLNINGPMRLTLDTAQLGERLTEEALVAAVRVEIVFTDMAGSRWRRRDSEQPRRVLADAA